MVVSTNEDTPDTPYSSILAGLSIIIPSILGYPHLWKPPLLYSSTSVLISGRISGFSGRPVRWCTCWWPSGCPCTLRSSRTAMPRACSPGGGCGGSSMFIAHIRFGGVSKAACCATMLLFAWDVSDLIWFDLIWLDSVSGEMAAWVSATTSLSILSIRQGKCPSHWSPMAGGSCVYRSPAAANWTFWMHAMRTSKGKVDRCCGCRSGEAGNWHELTASCCGNLGQCWVSVARWQPMGGKNVKGAPGKWVAFWSCYFFCGCWWTSPLYIVDGTSSHQQHVFLKPGPSQIDTHRPSWSTNGKTW